MRRKIGRGWHSTIYLTDRKTVIKAFKKGMVKNFQKELQMLTILKSYDFVPKILNHDSKKLEIEMEYIEGCSLKEFLKTNTNKKQVLNVIKKIFNICYILDRMKIQKEEMINPEKHIIISGDRVVFIDFERAIEKEKPSNLTQFVEYIYRRRNVLKKFGIEISNRDCIINLLKEYKKTYSRKIFEELFYKIFGEKI